MRKKVVIDVDTGVDDAQAIMIALTQPSVEVLAITCVSGNIDIDKVLVNTLRVLKALNRLDVPVYRGCGQSMLGKTYDATHIHGSDGLGDCPDASPPSLELVQPEHAVHALLRLVSKYPGEITLVALAPLTNIALAIRLDQEFGSKLKDAVIMGGNIKGVGNITVSGEFNFYCDPESASVVLNELACPIRLLTFEVCLENDLEWDWVDSLMAIDTPMGKFHHNIEEHTIRKKRILKGYYVCDPIAMTIAIDDGVVLLSSKCYCSVELAGHYTRGQMVVDWQSTLGRQPNVTLVTKVNTDIIKSFFENMLK